MSQKFSGGFLELVKQKIFYPYEYLNDFEKFNKDLPCKEEFFSVLNDNHIILVQKIMDMLLEF